ncbi:MAG: 2-oxoacid:acceptor oxidoreductase family protein [Candidatus Aenigmarchaeota archaeon]|nr:2-oxoacid:acceptor oxidoreductase family protein [Candidatus Aenigmarchaeota archaeon]
MVSFLLYGRGGQGVETATRILGSALFAGGAQVQDFVISGMELRGFPVEGYVKAEKEPLLSKDLPKADFLLVFDMTLPLDGVLRQCSEKAVVVFNSKDHVKHPLLKKLSLKSYFLNANEISYNYLRTVMPNTAMLGALAKLYPKVTMKNLKGFMQVPLQQDNFRAFDDGYRNAKRN